jgi:hypothetical protein
MKVPIVGFVLAVVFYAGAIFAAPIKGERKGDANLF